MNKTFAHHTPNSVALERIRQLRAGYSKLMDLILHHTTDGRDRDFAIEYLENSAMRAIKAVAMYKPSHIEDIREQPSSK